MKIWKRSKILLCSINPRGIEKNSIRREWNLFYINLAFRKRKTLPRRNSSWREKQQAAPAFEIPVASGSNSRSSFVLCASKHSFVYDSEPRQLKLKNKCRLIFDQREWIFFLNFLFSHSFITGSNWRDVCHVHKYSQIRDGGWYYL